ncbi:respiratory chain protein (SoxI-like) [Pyrobaculum ferrireducens]|nr:respiratory chain protein (SoxI-like) [Pyrobaculum ferrireducens]
MSTEVRLNFGDYVTWGLIIAAIFVVWMWAGNWGRPPYPVVSEVSSYVFTPYTVVYVGGGVVTALFMGSMIFFTIKFRAREGYGEE